MKIQQVQIKQTGAYKTGADLFMPCTAIDATLTQRRDRLILLHGTHHNILKSIRVGSRLDVLRLQLQALSRRSDPQSFTG